MQESHRMVDPNGVNKTVDLLGTSHLALYPVQQLKVEAGAVQEQHRMVDPNVANKMWDLLGTSLLALYLVRRLKVEAGAKQEIHRTVVPNGANRMGYLLGTRRKIKHHGKQKVEEDHLFPNKIVRSKMWGLPGTRRKTVKYTTALVGVRMVDPLGERRVVGHGEHKMEVHKLVDHLGASEPIILRVVMDQTNKEAGVVGELLMVAVALVGEEEGAEEETASVEEVEEGLLIEVASQVAGERRAMILMD